MKRAEFMWKHRNIDGYTTTLGYKYRGHEYVVTDYGWRGYSETLAEQHRNAQAEIDKLIEQRQREKCRPIQGPTVEEALDMFFEYFES